MEQYELFPEIMRPKVRHKKVTQKPKKVYVTQQPQPTGKKVERKFGWREYGIFKKVFDRYHQLLKEIIQEETNGVDEEGAVEAKRRIADRLFEEVGMNPQTVLDLLDYWKISYAHLYPAFLIIEYQKALAKNIYPCIGYETGAINKNALLTHSRRDA